MEIRILATRVGDAIAWLLERDAFEGERKIYYEEFVKGWHAGGGASRMLFNPIHIYMQSDFFDDLDPSTISLFKLTFAA